MSSPLLRPADLRLIHLVASRRRGEPTPDLDAAELDSLLGELNAADSGTTFTRTAGVAAGVSRLGDGGPLYAQMALLALCCQLALEGYTLVAPQGVLAGMITGLRNGRGNAASLARWLEDRALPVGVS